MVYLPTFTIDLSQMEVNIPYMDPMGYFPWHCERFCSQKMIKNVGLGRFLVPLDSGRIFSLRKMGILTKHPKPPIYSSVDLKARPFFDPGLKLGM